MQISTTMQFSLSAKIEYQTWNLPCSLIQTKIWTWEGGVEGRHYKRAWGTFCGAMDMLIIFIVVTVSWVCIAGPPYPQICFQWFHLPAVNCALKILLESPEINSSFVFNCMLLWIVCSNLRHLTSAHPRLESHLCPAHLCCEHYLPLSTQ